MLEHIPENTTARWEIRRSNSKAVQHYRTGLARSRREKQLLTSLTTVGSHALLKLGGALTSAGERLSGDRTSSRTAAA